MANMYSSLHGGKSSRTTDVFKDRPISAGASYYNGSYGITIRTEGKEWRKDRNYTLTLTPVDVGHILDRLIDPLGSVRIGLIDAPDRDSLFAPILAERGIVLEKYRYPAPPFADGTERWYYYDAVNRAHAVFQFNKLFRSFDESKLERVEEKGE